MYQTVMRRMVRKRLAETDLPLLEESEIEAYLYEVVAELPDEQAEAFVADVKLQARTGYQTAIVESVLSRVVRLIECDAILSRWDED